MRVRVFAPKEGGSGDATVNHRYKKTLEVEGSTELEDLVGHDDVDEGDILYAQDWWLLVTDGGLSSLGSSSALTQLYAEACGAENGGEVPQATVVTLGPSKSLEEAEHRVKSELDSGLGLTQIAQINALREAREEHIISASIWDLIAARKMDLTGETKSWTKEWLLAVDPAILEYVGLLMEDEDLPEKAVSDLLRAFIMLFSTDMGSPGEIDIGSSELGSKLTQFGSLCMFFILIRAGLARESTPGKSVWDMDWGVGRVGDWESLENVEEEIQKWVAENSELKKYRSEQNGE